MQEARQNYYNLIQKVQIFFPGRDRMHRTLVKILFVLLISVLLHRHAHAQSSISVNDTSVSEANAGTNSLAFTVRLSAAAVQAVTVDYSTSDGSATVADNDYAPGNGTLTIPAGDSSGTITITVNGDTKFEPDETFGINLSNAVNAVMADSQGIATIMNDDSQPSIAISDVTANEGNSGTTP